MSSPTRKTAIEPGSDGPGLVPRVLGRLGSLLPSLRSKTLARIALGLGIGSTMLTILVGGGIAIPLQTLNLILLVSAVVLLKQGDYIIPLLFSTLGYTGTVGRYKIHKDCLLLETPNGTWRAKSYLECRVQRSIIDMEESQKLAYIHSFSNLLFTIRHPIRISQLIVPLDLSKEERKIREKIASLEYRANKARLGQKPLTEKKLKDDAAYWTKLLQRITRGERPFQVLLYCEVSARGPTQQTAHTRLRSRTSEIRAILSAAMGVDAQPVKGVDMARITRFDYHLPEDSAELEEMTQW